MTWAVSFYFPANIVNEHALIEASQYNYRKLQCIFQSPALCTLFYLCMNNWVEKHTFCLYECIIYIIN